MASLQIHVRPGELVCLHEGRQITGGSLEVVMQVRRCAPGRSDGKPSMIHRWARPSGHSHASARPHLSRTPGCGLSEALPAARPKVECSLYIRLKGAKSRSDFTLVVWNSKGTI